MREIIRSNDAVLLSFAQVLLRDAGLEVVLADQHMSALEGSIGVLPRRLLVDSQAWARAAQILRDGDLGEWITRDA